MNGNEACLSCGQALIVGGSFCHNCGTRRGVSARAPLFEDPPEVPDAAIASSAPSTDSASVAAMTESRAIIENDTINDRLAPSEQTWEDQMYLLKFELDNAAKVNKIQANELKEERSKNATLQ